MRAMPAEHAIQMVAEQVKSRVGELLPPTHQAFNIPTDQASEQAIDTPPDENGQSCY